MIQLLIAWDDERGPSPIPRPRTRAECADIPRPCPFVTCRHHLYIDAHKGRARVAFAGEVSDMPADRSCALDVADDVADGEPLSLDDISAAVGLSREAVRLVVVRVEGKLREVGREGEVMK